MMRFRQALRKWWEGEYIPYENTPNSSVLIAGGDQKWHWTARIVRGFVFFARDEWKWIIGTALACIALLLAYLRLS